jgi:hypothetical protein
MKRGGGLILAALGIMILISSTAYGQAVPPVVDDPLVRMPGTQPNQVALEGPNRCLNCHAGYNTAVEPGFNWKGSMMAQSARDFLFWSCLAVGAQDSMYALKGNPNATDICLRCHFPKGWLEGRSDPTNATLMVGDDYDGVQCDFCHRMWDPFFESTTDGSREGSDWSGYWDEATILSSDSAMATYTEDSTIALSINLFAGGPFFTNNIPPANYTESGSGQYFVSPNAAKRASFADADARHQMLYSRFHKSKYMCATCHDVSNPILANLGLSGLPDDGTGLITEQYSAANYLHVERTFSEFMLSAYGAQGGAPTNPEFQLQGAPDITHAAKCQDCHMRDVVGVGADKRGAVLRPTDSLEHPNSGQPLHDLTGGNIWVSAVLASAVPGSPNYIAANDLDLNQGPAALTLDLTQGQGIDPAAMLAGVDRARQQLLLAATIRNADYSPSNGTLSFQVLNNGAHKLISGFPEGRRMFVNIKAYAADKLIYEVNPYDSAAGTLKGLDYNYQTGLGLPNPSGLADGEVYVDELVYEMKPASSLTGEIKTFHFALADGRYKDNRIPPKGFDIAGAADRISVPVWHGADDPNYYTSAEYSGGYDEVSLDIASGADRVEINLYYQTTSREYIEFLRDEINGTGNLTLPATAEVPNPYVVQTDPFFSQLAAWGDTIWNLWVRNKDLAGAAPFLMTQSVVNPPVEPPAWSCTPPVPTLDQIQEGNQTVTLTWVHTAVAPPDVILYPDYQFFYRVYYDQEGKAQLVADIPDPGVAGDVSFTDSGLTNGMTYCYKVTSWYDLNGDGLLDPTTECESGFSNILCAIPNETTVNSMGVTTDNLSTLGGTVFRAGDLITFQAVVEDQGASRVPGVDVNLAITGPTSLSLVATDNNDGVAVADWPTNNKGRNKTPKGDYTVTVTNVTTLDPTSPYVWDGVQTSSTFTIQ